MGNLHGFRGPASWHLIRRAAITSTLLSLLFVVVYGSTNWFTAQRPATQVHTWYFAWELTLIPYVPIFIVPYMSIDLFFFGAAFLCRDEQEMRVFARRVVFVILVAASFFLLMPLRLAWPERPHGSGWFGNLVDASCTAPFLMEYPHNLFPSLHIALRTLLAAIYARHTHGILRGLSHVWFSMIGLSTILTWQHHLVDIAGGFILAGFAFYPIRETPSRLSVVRNVRNGCYFGAAAVATLGLAAMLGFWGAFLLWPAAAFALMAGAYWGLGPGVYHKAHGRLPFSARFVFAPILLGQYLSLLIYRRRCRPWDRVTPQLLIGRVLCKAEATEAIHQGVTAVLDLTAEFREAAPFLGLRYRNVPILDLTAPTASQLQEAIEFITEETARGQVYVHCKIGYSRTAAVVGAYLLASGQATTADEATAQMRRARPSLIIRPEVLEALHGFRQSPVAAC